MCRRPFLAVLAQGALPRPDSSVVERGPEKAGVGGSIPSLATIIIICNSAIAAGKAALLSRAFESGEACTATLLLPV
jgi:hypothetical protein